MEKISEVFEALLQESDEIILKKIHISADEFEIQVIGEGAGSFPTDLLLNLLIGQEKGMLPEKTE